VKRERRKSQERVRIRAAAVLSRQRDGLLDWRKSRDYVDQRLTTFRLLGATAGLIATGFSVAANEYVVQGTDPLSTEVNFIKGCCSITSVICLMLIYRTYLLQERLERIIRHISQLTPLDPDISIFEPFRSRAFLIELAILGVHLPPGVTFELGVWNWNNFILYRGETLCTVVATFRVYLVWRILRDQILLRLPKRHTVSAYTRISFGSALTFKMILNSRGAMPFIAAIWYGMLFIFSYWYRSAEMTACQFNTAHHEKCGLEEARYWSMGDSSATFEKTNDLYMQNALWFIYVTTCTVGFGDVNATTTMGRIVACLTAIVGTLCVALLTAAFSYTLQWTAEEISAMMVIDREKARRVLKQHAARMLLSWMHRMHKRKRGYQPKPLRKLGWKNMVRSSLAIVGNSVQDQFVELLEDRKAAQYRHEFQRIKQCCHVDIEDCQGDEVRIDQVSARTRYLEDCSRMLEARTRFFGQSGIVRNQSIATIPADAQPGGIWSKEASKSRRGFSISMRSLQASSMKSIGTSYDTLKPSEAADSQLAPPTLTIAQSSGSTGERVRPNTHQESEHTAEDVDHGINEMEPAKFDHPERRPSRMDTEDDMAHADKGRGENSRDLFRETIMSGGKGFAKNLNRTKESWRRNRSVVHERISSSRVIAAVVSVVGTAAAVMQNELIQRGVEPRSAIVDFCKAINTVASLVCSWAIYRAHWHATLKARLEAHLTRGVQLDVDVTPRAVILKTWFWVEVIICGVHVPPGVTSEVGGLNMDNFVVYRIETMGCVWNMFRFYLLWWSFVEFMVYDLPMRHTVAAFANVKFESVFAMKRALNSWWAFFYISIGGSTLIILLGYIFMASEASSCLLPGTKHKGCADDSAKFWVAYSDHSKFEKVNDLHVANACWFIFVTMTTIGYGDIAPSTHVGRFVAVIAAQVGIILVSLITAALANLMKYDTSEQSAMVIIGRESAKLKLATKAQEIIARWYKNLKGFKLSHKQEHSELYRMIIELRHHRQDCQVEIEDCVSTSVKIEQIASRVKLVEKNLDAAAHNLWGTREAARPKVKDLEGMRQARKSIEMARKKLGAFSLVAEQGRKRGAEGARLRGAAGFAAGAALIGGVFQPPRADDAHAVARETS